MSVSARASEVTMRRYSEREIEAYVASGEPFDKAGAYAVQDIDFRPTASVRGCYLNVVGLPLCDVVTMLDGLGGLGRLRAGWSPPLACVGCSLTPANGASTS
jgi:predicted house-cleaning NTP pyrophosphatase (Maf/HAM1 superfamily)